jgi:NAD(P)H-dependent FMN reductase
VLQRYRHLHTKRWAASERSGCVCIFSPEYNYTPSLPLLNALNYLYKKWNSKLGSIVSYRGVTGGVRAALVEKIMLTTLKMIPVAESVGGQNVATHIDANHNFLPDEHHLHGAELLLNKLYKWAQALKTMRQWASQGLA